MARRRVPDWTAPAGYVVGDVVRWQGAELLCTFAHGAGEGDAHPWASGDGWPPGAAALLWTPMSDRDALRLRELGKQCPLAGRCAALGLTEPIPRAA